MKNLLTFYSSAHSDAFKKQVMPITDCYGLDVVLYTCVQADGTFFQLSNQPDVSSYYWENQLFYANPFIRHPKFARPGTYLISDFASKDFATSQAMVKEYYDSDNVLITFIKQKNSLFWMAFSATKATQPLQNLFLHERYLLEKFALFFHKSWSKNLFKMDRYSENIAEKLGARFLEPKNQRHMPYSDQRKCKLLEQIGALTGDVHIPKLTRREKECLELLLMGKTSSLIGEFLHLSHRTVESYLSTLKNKFNCSNKPELIEVATLLHQAGLLSFF